MISMAHSQALMMIFLAQWAAMGGLVLNLLHPSMLGY
jgi:hypothetical protein